MSTTLAKTLPTPRQSPEHEQLPSEDSSLLLANRLSTSSHEATQRRLLPLSEDLEARIHEAALTCRRRCSHRLPLQLSPDLVLISREVRVIHP